MTTNNKALIDELKAKVKVLEDEVIKLDKTIEGKDLTIVELRSENKILRDRASDFKSKYDDAVSVRANKIEQENLFYKSQLDGFKAATEMFLLKDSPSYSGVFTKPEKDIY